MTSERTVTFQLLDYLMRNPHATDTLEGIAQWWLLEERIHRSIVVIRAALAEMAAKKFILVRQSADGRAHYRLNSKKKAEIRRLLSLSKVDSSAHSAKKPASKKGED